MVKKSHNGKIVNTDNRADRTEISESLPRKSKIDFKTSILPIIAIALIAIFYSFWTISAEGMLPGDNRDIILVSVQATPFVKSILEYHQFSLWDNFWITGHPAYASSVSSSYYVFGTLFNLLFGAPDSYNYSIPFHLFLSGVAFWLFSSTILSNKSMRFFGSVTYMLSGVISAKIGMGHIGMFTAFPYIPLTMYFLSKSYLTKNSKFIVLSGLSMSMFVFSGAAYFLVFFMFLFAIYAFTKIVDLEHLLKNKKYLIDKNNLKVSIIIFVLFAMLSAVRIIPMVLFTDDMVRIDPINPLEGGVLFKDAFILFITSGGWEHESYLGFIPIALAVVSIFHNSKNKQYMYMGIVVFLIWVSVKNSFFWWIHLFPFLDSLRAPVRVFGFISFLIIALSLYGFEVLVEAFEKSKKYRNIILGSVIFLIFFELQEFIIGIAADVYDGARIGILLTVTAFSFLSWTLIKQNNWKQGTKKMVFAIMSFAILALVMNNTLIIAPADNPLNEPTAPKIIQEIKDFDSGTNTQIWVTTNGWPYQHQEFAYHAVKNGVHIVRAYYAYYVKDMPSSINIDNQIYNVANYIIDTQYLETGIKADIAGLEKVTEVDGVSVYKIENSLSNAFSVNENGMQSLNIKYFSPNKVIVDGSKIKQGDLVVLKTAYYNGWMANGKPAINAGNMVSTTAETSNDDIIFKFDPMDFKIGFAITMFTLIFCVIICLRKETNVFKFDQ